MVQIRNWIVAALLLLSLQAKPQTVYYPAGASQLLKSTADDVAMLLQKAVTGSKFSTSAYTRLPAEGIVLIYDPVVNYNNQACMAKGNGTNYLSFAASQDNGLCFGVYQYLNQLGFRFYQPGTIWEIIPSLTTAFKSADTTYACQYKYKNWFISGGMGGWVMDNSKAYPWDIYSNDNGHALALYQRRNNMTGGYRFTGHRGDIMTGSFMELLKNTSCYVAPYNGSRQATVQSVTDINSTAGMQAWSDAIETKYTTFKNNIFANQVLYTNQYHNFDYSYEHLGIEVPDGAHWANSRSDDGCITNDLKRASDQQFILSGFTALAINKKYPDKKFQLYAYSSHADIPSPGIPINKNIDVQVVASVYQNETSEKGLLNRWYNKHPNVSEYQYFNLDQWSGGTPAVYLKNLQNTLLRLKEKNSQGIVWEASPSKFASLPFLLAANRQLIDGTMLETTLQDFCKNLFGSSAASVFTLLKMWSDPKTMTTASGAASNRYKLPLYFDLLNKAIAQSQKDPAIVQERLDELKAYLHYMMLYYNWAFDQRPANAKANEAAGLCLYLAKTNKLQIVNSYWLINIITSQYKSTDIVYKLYNNASGTAYQQGGLPLITKAEIDKNFQDDLAEQQSSIKEYKLEEPEIIKESFVASNLAPLQKIAVSLNYTQGQDYYGRSEYYFIADKPGSIVINYNAVFSMAGKGQVNFIAEETGKALGIVKDVTIYNGNGKGTIKTDLPAAGTYKLTVSSLFKTSVQLEIETNGNYFYRIGPFLGTTLENYHNDMLSLPGYFFVPKGLEKVFFSINNSNNAGAGFKTPVQINQSFLFKDPTDKAALAKLVSSKDSALFYLDVLPGMDGQFWKASKMEGYKLCFANITNAQWYASKKDCGDAAFKVDIINKDGECITRLTGSAGAKVIKWKLSEGSTSNEYGSNQSIDLPVTISPNAIVTQITDDGCTVTQKLADYPGYLAKRSACAAGSFLPQAKAGLVIYPNPGNGLYKCMLNNEPVTASAITIYSAQGTRTASFTNSQQFNIAHLPAAMYAYKLTINETVYTGKLVKL